MLKFSERPYEYGYREEMCSNIQRYTSVPFPQYLLVVAHSRLVVSGGVVDPHSARSKAGQQTILSRI